MNLPDLGAVLLPLLLSIAGAAHAEDRTALADVRRIVFVGDSITYAGQYIEFLEAWLRAEDPDLRCEFLDLGLPSETVSGLSEPGHAGGQFPRPDLHERLDRVLAQARPDLLVACYGMNDGIYAPFAEERFARFREGMQYIRDRAAAAGAKVLHLTPPVFDPVPIRDRTLPAGRDEYRQPYVGYDEVLNLYAAWLVAQRGNGWEVVDLHTPLRRELDDRRRRDADFRLAGDGVHLDTAGHRLIARTILDHWSSPAADRDRPVDAEAALAAHPRGEALLDLVQKKQRLRKDAWLTATGHRRPGMKPGLPLDDAEREAARLEEAIRALLHPQP